MTFALSEDHRSLAAVVESFTTDQAVLRSARAMLDQPVETLPPFWGTLGAVGWLGLHVPETWGGQGFGLMETAIVLERLGAAACPGPSLPTVVASAVLARAGSDAMRERWLPGLAEGSTIGAVGHRGGLTRSGSVVAGEAGLVVGGVVADVLLLTVGDDLVVVEARAPGVTREPVRDLDLTRRTARVSLAGVTVEPDSVISGGRAIATLLGRGLASAEAAGGARTCVEMSAQYAKDRVQFGRPIGTFQAVKHLCANLLVDAEMVTAAAWDACRSSSGDPEDDLAGAVAAIVSLGGFVRCAERNIQVHGGIGYTWDHDAHLFLRRALSLRAVLGGDEAPGEVAAMAASGVRRHLAVDLPPEAEQYRAAVREFVELDAGTADADKRVALSRSGYLVPHWPRPWGRGAGAIEQLVIEEELGGRVAVPELGITGWVALTLAQHGSEDQLARWIQPTLDGELQWCQLFSEPNAGSDAAAITTRAVRVEGGWLVTGQKVWTSGADSCDWGFATVRTNPDAPKHAGITMVAIEMNAAGVEVRPLRDLTGRSTFNEVFFDSAFVSDDNVVGPVDGGWNVARATLGNERVSIGSRKVDERSALNLLALADRFGRNDDAALALEIGILIAEEQSRRALGVRQAARAVSGAGPGPEGNVSKLLAGEHTQRVADLGLRIAQDGILSGDEHDLVRLALFSRCLTIAGGTSEIVRNQIAERILQLPRDPLTSDRRAGQSR